MQIEYKQLKLTNQSQIMTITRDNYGFDLNLYFSERTENHLGWFHREQIEDGIKEFRGNPSFSVLTDLSSVIKAKFQVRFL